MPRRHRESILLNVFFYGHVRQYHNIQAEIDANIHEVAPAASSSWVQQATRRKTAREPSTRRAPQKRRSEVRTMSHKVIFLGQGTTPARRGAARRRTGKDPPARLLLPGGLTQARKARKILRGSPSHNATCRRACLECLLDFGGQFHAHLLDRKGALDLLDTVLGDQRHDS